MDLSNLKPPKGAKHSKKRIGRGQGSGQGKTAGRRRIGGDCQYHDEVARIGEPS